MGVVVATNIDLSTTHAALYRNVPTYPLLANRLVIVMTSFLITLLLFVSPIIIPSYAPLILLLERLRVYSLSR